VKEKLQVFALIAEIISGIAVVATLVILIVSIQRNTEATSAMMFANLNMNGGMESLAVADPELNEIYTAWLQMRTSELTEEQKSRVARIAVIAAKTYDTAYTLRNSGLLGANEWEARSRYLCDGRSRAISAGFERAFLGLMSLELQNYVAATCND
jgi:hypothetical protein